MLIIEDFLITISSQPIVSGIKLQQDLSAERDTIHCDGDQLRQVLLNIVINAADAIHESTPTDSGEITITTCQ